MADQIDFAIGEIKKNSKSPKKHVEITEYELGEHKQRVSTKIPNISLFTIPTGKVYGDVMQDIIIASFDDIKKHTADTHYDAECGKLKLEIKTLRALNGKDKDSFIAGRIYNKTDRNIKFSTSSFQQSKPSFCDWFIFHILYGDADRLFLIPSKCVSKKSGLQNKEPGKLLLSKQHGTSPIEGQVNLGEVLKCASYFEIDYDHNKKYKFATFAKKIEKRLANIDWALPN